MKVSCVHMIHQYLMNVGMLCAACHMRPIIFVHKSLIYLLQQVYYMYTYIYIEREREKERERDRERDRHSSLSKRQLIIFVWVVSFALFWDKHNDEMPNTKLIPKGPYVATAVDKY